MLGIPEMAIIAGVAGVFLFGPAFLRKMGSAVGDSIREFRKVKKELAEPLVIEEDDAPLKTT